jgi:hypothetical protein
VNPRRPFTMRFDDTLPQITQRSIVAHHLRYYRRNQYYQLERCGVHRYRVFRSGLVTLYIEVL